MIKRKAGDQEKIEAQNIAFSDSELDYSQIKIHQLFLLI
jgi:hypothetical protein